MNMPLRSIVLLSVLLGGLHGMPSLAQAAVAGNPNAGTDLSALLSDTGEYDFLVEFDDSALKKKYSDLRTLRRRSFNDATMRAEFAGELKTFKQGILGPVQFDRSAVTRDYSNLPLLQ
jgi:hypothetical protein